MILLAGSIDALAQSVRGKVTSGVDGSPLPGVSVLIKGTAQGTSTDTEGAYVLDVPSNSTLVFSFIGFVSKEEIVGNRATIDVALSEDAAQLNEVVVTALGIQKEAKQLGYPVQKIGSKDINMVAPPNMALGMMGKIAGLNISTPNGIEGSSQRIVIRGNNSLLGNNQPLIVIDGVQVQDNALGKDSRTGTESSDLGALKDWGSYLNFVNSEDIEEVNVLKGPTAAALYGARGANGVIQITTKKGTKKSGLGIDYSLSTRWTDVYRYQEMQDEYGYGGAIGLWSAEKTFPRDENGNEVYPAADPWQGVSFYDGRYFSQGDVPGGKSSWNLFSWYGTAASWGPRLDGREITWWDGTRRKWAANPDNIRSFFRTGNTTTHNVSVSGGGEFGTVRASISRSSNKAVVPNSKFDQTTVNVGSNIDISKKMRLEVTSSYTNFNRLNTPDIGDNNSWTKFMVYGMSRDYINLERDLYVNADGSKNLFNTDTYRLGYPYAQYGRDIYWNTFENNTEMERDQLLGSIKLNYEVTPWLSIMGRTGIDYNTNEFETKKRPIDAAGVRGEYGLDMNKNHTINSDVIASLHSDKFLHPDLTANLSLGAGSWYNRYHGSKQWNKGPFSIPFQYFLRNTTENLGTNYNDWLPDEYRSESKINSAYGILDLGFRDYLFLQVTGRNDWSSTLPAASNSFFYPSASLSFVFTEALGLGSGVLSYGKIRGAYAASANGTDPYRTSYVYKAGAFGGSPTRSLQQSLPPLALEPQRSNSYEFGFQLGFLQNLVSVDFTYYRINSTSQILSAPIPVSSGVSSVTFNTGELQNQGFEFIVKASPVKTNDFRWDISFNGAHNQNKVISLDEGVDTYPLGDVFGITYGAAQQVRVGENYGTIYGYDFKYLNGKKVVERIMDANNEQVIGTKYVTTDAPVAIGNSTPKLTGGIGNSLNFKNFSLYALVDFKLGGDLYSTDFAAAMGNGLSPQTLVERNGGGLPYTYPDGSTANHGVVLDGVFADGTPNTDVVNYMFKYASVYSGWSDIHMPRSASVFKNSWSKLRELSLSYTVPKSIVEKSRVFQGLSVSLIGRDLFYLFTTLPDRLNPEGINGVGNTQGLQWSAFPGTRSYGFSVKAQL